MEEEEEGHSQQREQHTWRTGSKREDTALRKRGLGAESGNTGRTGTLGVGVSNGGVAGGGVERLEESESSGGWIVPLGCRPGNACWCSYKGCLWGGGCKQPPTVVD